MPPRKDPNALTPKESAFVNEYMVDLNATQAAIRAGYSERSAKEIGCQNLTKTNIRNAIDEQKQKRSEATTLTAEYVLKKLADIIEVCSQRIPVTDKTGEPTGFDAILDPKEANKAIELAGKHLALFTDKSQVTINGGMAILQKYIQIPDNQRD